MITKHPEVKSDADIQIVGAHSLNGWILVATWTEPEDGACVLGVFDSAESAREATYTDEVREQFAVEDEDGGMIVTDDVTWIIAPIGTPFLT